MPNAWYTELRGVVNFNGRMLIYSLGVLRDWIMRDDAYIEVYRDKQSVYCGIASKIPEALLEATGYLEITMHVPIFNIWTENSPS